MGDLQVAKNNEVSVLRLNFHVLTRVNEIEANVWKAHVNVEVERLLTLTFTGNLSYITSILITRVYTDWMQIWRAPRTARV